MDRTWVLLMVGPRRRRRSRTAGDISGTSASEHFFVVACARRVAIYRIVAEHLETFLDEAREKHERGLPDYVERELREYLKCGILPYGFLLCYVLFRSSAQAMRADGTRSECGATCKAPTAAAQAGAAPVHGRPVEMATNCGRARGWVAGRATVEDDADGSDRQARAPSPSHEERGGTTLFRQDECGAKTP